MKPYQKILALFLCLNLTTSLLAQKIVGYIPGSYRDISQMDAAIEWEKMTDYYYFGSYPTAAGDIVLESKEPGLGGLNHVVAKAALHSKNVWLSVGGWGKSSNFISVARNSTAMDAFCNRALELCVTYGLTGIDIDWEFPSYGQEADFRDFFKALYAKLNPEGYLVSAAAGGEATHADKWLDETFDYIDDLNIMSYDDPSLTNGNHASLKFMQDAMSLYYTQGCPYEKMLGGVAFYSRCGGVLEYFNVLNGASDKLACYENDLTNTYCYNGKNTIIAKTDYVMSQGGLGILIWEVTQDALGTYSLLNACDEAMEPYRCAAPSPDLGSDVSICGVSSVTLDGGVPLQAGVTFTWKDGAGTLVNGSSTANTYDALTAGTYTLEVWQGGCSRSDEIEVTSVLNTPSLGGPYELCDPVSVTLDAGALGAGRTIEWQLNDVTINGATASTFDAKKGGTYKVLVSATGCSSVNSSAVVTSEVPYAENDTICLSNDEADLMANEIVKWYATSDAVVEIETSQNFTPIVASNTTYWMGGAGSALTEYDFLQGMSTAWNRNGANYYSRKLVVLSELTLNTLKIDAVTSGSVTVNLRPASTTTLPVEETMTTSVTAGENVINLNWIIQPGEYYIDADGTSIQMVLRAAPSSDFEIPGIITSEAKGYASWGTYTLLDNAIFFYDMLLTAGRECARVPVNVNIDAGNPSCLSVSSKELSLNSLKVYPNPSNSEFTVSGINGDVQVFDLKGAVVETYANVANQLTFGAELEKGVYFVQVNNNGNVITQKVIKQ